MTIDLNQPAASRRHALHWAESAPACGIVAALHAVLVEDFAATASELYLVDYRLSVLQPVLLSSQRPIGATQVHGVDQSEVGRVFVTQRREVALADGTGEAVARLPVTLRGDRLGVLEVKLSGPPSEEVLGQLERVATELAYAICVAKRDTDVFERASRAQSLSLEAEMQWQLLPGKASSGPGYRLAGQLEPAYYVAGDSFDWCVAAESAQLSLCDAMGRGVVASELATLAVTALRNARRNDIGLADQARCADQAIYAVHAGERFVNAVLLRFDHASKTASAVSAGSTLLIRQRGNEVVPLALKTQLPLGLFENTDYVEQQLDVVPGDRVIAVSDGLYSARPPGGEEFGAGKLTSLLRSMSALLPSEAVRRVIKELISYHSGASLRDDAIVLVFDWLSLPSGSSPCGPLA